MPAATFRVVGLTVLAMIAFAANSVLTRLALAEPIIDPASFGTIRVGSGAIALCLLLLLAGRRPRMGERDGIAALMLTVYVVCFSFAYLTLATGTGALILFGAVQLTMFGWALGQGERPGAIGWGGLAMAFAGLVWLMLPGIEAPEPFGAGLMTLAGVAWGVYSLRGRGAADPLGRTAVNFLLALPLAALVSLMFWADRHATGMGLALAVASGTLASAAGYTIWYAALPALTAGTAAMVQLSAPVIAALGGVLFLTEPVTMRLGLSAIAVLGGIALFISARR